jgi:hypothetical protein
MIERIVEFSVRRRWLVLFLVLAATLSGIWSLSRLPIDAVPDVTNVQVQVNAVAPALTPLEIEKQVTVALETALAGIPGMEATRSFSRNGFAQITVVFADRTNIYFARQMVTERINDARSLLPPNVDVRLGPVSTGLGEIYWWAVEYEKPGASSPVRNGQPGWQSDGSYLTPEGERLADDFNRTVYLRTVQDWIIRPQMRSVRGVAGADAIGGFVKQFQVQPDPQKLIGLGITLDQIITAIEKNNASRGANYIEQNGEGLVVRAAGRVENADDIARIVVSTRGGVPVRVRDVAEVVIGRELRTGSASANGHEIVLGTALMLVGENSRTVAAAAAAKIDEINKTLPSGIRARTVLNRTELVDATIRTVATNLAEGALLVVAVLFLMLGNFRAAVVTACVIPITMMITATGMLGGRISANLMSLGALDFGLIVDGAVIIAENSLRHFAERQAALRRTLTREERLETVSASTIEMIRPTVYGQVIIILVYAPLLAFTGVEGKTFEPLALTVMIALAVAFVVSLTFVPAAIAIAITKPVREKENFLVHGLKSAYVPLLSHVMARPAPIAVAAVLLFAGALMLFTTLGQEFTPTLDEKNIVMEVKRIPSTSITQSQAMQLQIEKLVSRIPEVAFTFSRTGTPDLAADPMPPNASDTYIIVKPQKEWSDPSMTKQDLIAKIEAEAGKLPGNKLGFSQPIQMRFNELIAGVREDLGGQGVRRRLRRDADGRGPHFRRAPDGGRRGEREGRRDRRPAVPRDPDRQGGDRPARAESSGRPGRHRDRGRRSTGGPGFRRRQALSDPRPSERRAAQRRRCYTESAGAVAPHRRRGRDNIGAAQRHRDAGADGRRQPDQPRERQAARGGDGGGEGPRHRIAGRRGAGQGGGAGEAAAWKLSCMGRPVREFRRCAPAADAGRAGLLRADLSASVRCARVVQGRPPCLQRGAAGAHGRYRCAVASGDAILHLGRRRIHRPVRRSGVERSGHAYPHPAADRRRNAGRPGRAGRRSDALQTRRHDGARRVSRLRADGAGDRHRCRGAAAARDRRHRRSDHGDTADPRRPAGALRPIRWCEAPTGRA